MDFLFVILVLIFSVVIHEVSHGYAAKAQGDNTAEYMGRLTLNPLTHLDPFGSVILPFSLYILSQLSGGPMIIFGWAKPVPFNPFNLRNLRWGPALVGLAGPASNIAIAAFFGFAAQIMARLGFYSGSLFELLAVVIFINLLLGLFNLVPIPPLDGSKILFAILPDRMSGLKLSLEQYGWFILLAFLFLGLPFIFPLVRAAFRIVTGGAIPL